MLTPPVARELAAVLASSVLGGRLERWREGRARVEGLDGAGWLLLDDVARWSAYGYGTPIGGTEAWLGVPLDEPSGFVAAVASLHADGRIRQRATRAPVGELDRLRAAALAVREEASAALSAWVDASRRRTGAGYSTCSRRSCWTRARGSPRRPRACSAASAPDPPAPTRHWPRPSRGAGERRGD